MADLMISGSAGSLRSVQFTRQAAATAATGATALSPAATTSGQSSTRANTTATFAGGLSQSTLLAAQSSSGAGGGATDSASGLTEDEQAVVAEMKQTDAEIRAHEMAHLAAGGQFATGPSYEYDRGPDGGLYVIAGEVHIDTSPVPGDPEATIAKAEQVRAAALAPGDPSAQDRSVANAAAQMAAQASAEAIKQKLNGDEGGADNDKARPPSLTDPAENDRRPNAANPLDPRQDDPAARNVARTYDAVAAMVAAVQQQTVSIAA